jgi:hypothetical protein
MQLRVILSVLWLMHLCLPIAAQAKQSQSNAEIALRTMHKELIAAKDVDLKSSVPSLTVDSHCGANQSICFDEDRHHDYRSEPD